MQAAQQQPQLQQQQPLRPDSPPSMLNHTHISLKHPSDSMFALQSPQLSNHSLYSNMQAEYGPMLDHDGQKQQQQAKANGFAPGPYRSAAVFSSFPNSNRPRTNTAPGPFRDTATSAFSNPFTTSTDVYGNPQPQLQPHITSPTQQPNPFDGLHQGRGFDYGNGPAVNPALNKPSSSFGIDPFGNASSAALLQHQVGKSQQQLNGPGNGYPQQQHPSVAQVPYMNGLHVQSQTPYGPHLQTNGAGAPVPVNGSGASGAGPNGIGHVNGNSASQNPSQEEISTIFVVGFPDDMQEREFQNMFTFSQGFEAATLKIPNKEYTAYGGNTSSAAGGMRSGPSGGGLSLNYSQSYAGSNDPYNLVTVNQGGVVVDGGRDGTTASWPATVPGLSDDGTGHFAGGTQAMPPRKQIIGFAKFRSRAEALDARDLLQGRRVDIEKGAVLKAEMAKKNLHTKRGVGPLPGVGAGGPPNEALAGLAAGMNVGVGAISGLQGMGGGGELSARERELGALGAMGFGGMNSQWRDNRGLMDRENDERRERETMGLTRGPRERAEEEERERRRREKEARLRSTNANAFDAFHSVPPQMMSRHASNSLLASGSLENTQPQQLNNGGYGLQEDVPGSSPWDANGLNTRKMSSVTALPPRPPSSARQPSPSIARDQTPSASFSPALSNSVLPAPPHPSLPTRPRPQSSSSVSSAAGGSQSSGGGGEGEALAVSTNPGTTSPQLPSPASGASSTGARNAIDQNPPINTLYVGNLPTSQAPPGYPPNQLEESLRELFQPRPGFRKLCFRQKNNGPMCFVEFEDVPFATRALNDLYGNTLNGLVKGGGIRLSYSKNPLGVRTPTSGGTGQSLQQQQQQVQNGMQTVNAMFATTDTLRSGPSALRSEMSPPSNFNYMASPPPRFFSPTPSSTSFAATAPRASNGSSNSSNYGGAFSPFGVSTPPPHTIPDQVMPVEHHFPHRALSPSASNLEAARAS